MIDGNIIHSEEYIILSSVLQNTFLILDKFIILSDSSSIVLFLIKSLSSSKEFIFAFLLNLKFNISTNLSFGVNTATYLTKNMICNRSLVEDSFIVGVVW